MPILVSPVDANLVDEIVLFNRALTGDEIKQLLNGWADAFPVHAQGKMSVTWGEIKSQN